jgi:hypothetical protein
MQSEDKISRFFIFLLLAVLLSGLITTVFFGKDINAYENRYANKIKNLDSESYLDKTFQDSCELALSDQIQLSTLAKRVYNFFETSLSRFALNPLRKSYDGYIYYKGNIIYKNMLLFAPYPYDPTVYWLNFKIENYNKLFSNYPDLDFYAYYIEKDTDIDFTENKQAGFYEYIKSNLTLDEDRISGFEVNDFDTFKNYFFTTDHHWNNVGSYKGYVDVMKLLDPDTKPLMPLETITSAVTFQGSKKIGFENVLYDTMSVYRFDYPDMEVYVNGLPVEDYGNQEDFLLGNLNPVGYGPVYGNDEGEVIFDTDNDSGNLLIIGESYDNAIVKLIASHYDRTYCVDLRYYEHYMEKPFVFSEYIKNNDIDKVLLIGNIDFYTLKDFYIEGDE